jgi:actin-related protein
VNSRLPYCCVIVFIKYSHRSLIGTKKKEFTIGATSSEYITTRPGFIFGEEVVLQQYRSYFRPSANPYDNTTFLSEEEGATNTNEQQAAFLNFCLSLSPSFSHDSKLVLVDKGLEEVSEAQNTTLGSILFDTNVVDGLSIGNRYTSILASCNLSKGLVLNCGLSKERAVVVDEGKVVEHTFSRGALGGNDLTMGIIPNIVGAFDSMSLDLNRFQKDFYLMDVSEKIKINSYDYELPDGAQLRIDNSKDLLEESKSLLLKQSASMISNTLEKCGGSVLRRDLCANIVLSGGSYLFPSFKSDLSAVLGNKYPGELVRIHNAISSSIREEKACDDSFLHYTAGVKDAAYIGARMLASLSSFTKSHVISKSMYEEEGGTRVFRKYNF